MTDGDGDGTSTVGGDGDGEAVATPADVGPDGAWSGAASGPTLSRGPRRKSLTPFVPSTRLSVVSPFESSGDSLGSDSADAAPVLSPSLVSLRRRMRRLFHKPTHLLGVHEVLHRHTSDDEEVRGSGGNGNSLAVPTAREPPGEEGASADGGDPLSPWPATLIRRTASLLLPQGAGVGGHGPSTGVIDSPPDPPADSEVVVRRRLSVLSFTSLWGGDDALSADEALDASGGAGAEEAPVTRTRLYGHLNRASKGGGARRTAPHTPTVGGGGAALSQSRHSPAEEGSLRWDLLSGPEQTGLSSRRDRPHPGSTRRVAEVPASPRTAARLSGRLAGGAGGGGGGSDGVGGKHGGRERPKDALGGWKRGDPVSYGALALSGGEPSLGRRPLPSKASGRYRSTSTPALACDKRAVGHRRDTSADRRKRRPVVGGSGGRDGPASLGGGGGSGGSGGGGGGQPPQTVVLLVGCPGSGKSTFAERHLTHARGYVRVSTDDVGTVARAAKAVREALALGQSVVVDNTHGGVAARKVFLDAARRAAPGAVVKALVFDTPRETAWHLNLLREGRVVPAPPGGTATAGAAGGGAPAVVAVPPYGYFGGRRRVPTVAFNVFAARYVEPTTDEGFHAIGHVRFVPSFRNSREVAIFCQRT